MEKILQRVVPPVFSLGRRCYCSMTLNKARETLSQYGDGKVLLEKDEESGIATVTLDHSQKKNALSGRMMVQLDEVVQHLENWKTGKGVILQSTGDTFCSGGDLTTVRAISNPKDGLLMSTFMHNCLTRFYCLPLVTVTIVQGRALGGGAELTTVTDYRIFTKNAEVSFVQGKMGVVTGWGGGTRLVKLLGAKSALDLMLCCTKINYDVASKLGFVDHFVEETDKYSCSKSWLLSRLNHDYTVIQALKKIVVCARDETLENSLKQERLCFSPLWGGDANKKALHQNIKHM